MLKLVTRMFIYLMISAMVKFFKDLLQCITLHGIKLSSSIAKEKTVKI